MGIRFIIFLGLLAGVLYCLHLLAKDYQAITAPRLLRFLFKRDVNTHTYKGARVRWKQILFYDPIQCARYLYCDLGARPPDNELRQGLIYMLTLEPYNGDEDALGKFKMAYTQGVMSLGENCGREYPFCPFSASLLLQLMQYVIRGSNSTI